MMRLNEIAGLPATPTNSSRTEVQDYYDTSDKFNYRGSGVYANVYRPKNYDVSTVVKISDTSGTDIKKDAYYQWILRVLKLQNNRYMPQITSAEVMAPKSGARPYLDVKMERLHDSGELSLTEIVLMIEQMCGIHLRQENEDGSYKQTDVIDWIRVNRSYAIELLLRWTILGDPFKRNHLQLIVTDPELLMVVKVLKHLMRIGCNYDLHQGNFMYRRTQYGPQLVITDPVAGQCTQIHPMSEDTIDIEPSAHGIWNASQHYNKVGVGKHMGSGCYGSAYKLDNTDVEQIAKVSRASNGHIENDGYYKWVKAVLDAPANRYLPQIYKATIKQPNQKVQHVAPYLDVKMERLHHVNYLTDAGIKFISTQMFGKQFDHIDTVLARLRNLCWCDVKTVHENVKDPDLLDVIMMIRTIIESGFCGDDLHDENIMIRVTKFGPQLVFTDPIS